MEIEEEEEKEEEERAPFSPSPPPPPPPPCPFFLFVGADDDCWNDETERTFTTVRTSQKTGQLLIEVLESREPRAERERVSVGKWQEEAIDDRPTDGPTDGPTGPVSGH